MKSNTLWILPLFALGALVTYNAVAEDTKKSDTVIEVMEKAPEQPTDFVKKTDEEWKKELTPEQYRILREAGTERADGKVYDTSGTLIAYGSETCLITQMPAA